MKNRQKTNRGRGSNLTHHDRVIGGQNSAAEQERDERGRFAGKNRSMWSTS